MMATGMELVLNMKSGWNAEAMRLRSMVRRKPDVVWLACILILTALPRLVGLAQHGLWSDERISVSNAVGSRVGQPLARPTGSLVWMQTSGPRSGLSSQP
jgi:hypothetical protein